MQVLEHVLYDMCIIFREIRVNMLPSLYFRRETAETPPLYHRNAFMPFLLAEILNFQGSTHFIDVGSLSN